MISPAPYVERYGADTARCYMLFIGPPDQDADWSDEGVEGVHRFLGRLWRMGTELAHSVGTGPPLGPLDAPEGDDLELMRKAHWAIDKVTRDMAGRFAFNTAIAAVMELVNECYRRRDEVQPATLHFATATAASLIFPFAPHTGSEVYELLTGERVWETPWPEADPLLLERDTVQVVVQINGKLRDRMEVASAPRATSSRRSPASAPATEAHLDGNEIVKVVVVPGKLVNFVVAEAGGAAVRDVDRGDRAGRCRRPRSWPWPRRSAPRSPRRGAILVCGGLGGVMEAACRGARSARRRDRRAAARRRPRGRQRLGPDRGADRPGRGAQRARRPRGRCARRRGRGVRDAQRDRARAEAGAAGDRARDVGAGARGAAVEGIVAVDDAQVAVAEALARAGHGRHHDPLLSRFPLDRG